MGDGMGALAVLILGAMVLLLAGGALIGWLVGRMATRGTTPGRRRAIIGATTLIGLVAGGLAVTATFYESTWAPPPQARVAVPAGFAHEWAFVLEDPKAPTTLIWAGSNRPFAGWRTDVAMPPSGVLRVRDLGVLKGRGDAQVVWSDGAVSTGMGGGPGPDGTGALSYVAFDRGGAPDAASEPPFSDPAAFAAYLGQREGRAPVP